MTTAPPPLDPDDAFAVAWQEHAAHVESKLDAMAHAFAGMVEEVTRQGDPSRHPDSFAVAALNAAVTWSKSTSGGTVADLTSIADRFEAWIRKPRPTTEAS